MLTLTRERKENAPFSLKKKVVSHYERVCLRCHRNTSTCRCYPVDHRNDRDSRRYSRRKVRGAYQLFREPSVFGESAERRRYKTITFKEEDLDVTQRLTRDYFAFVAEEIQNRLIRL